MMRILRTKQLAQAFVLPLYKISDGFCNDTVNLTETLDFDARKWISDAKNLVPNAGDEAEICKRKK